QHALGNELIGPIDAREEYAGGLADRVGDDCSLGQFESQRGLDQLPGDASNSTANGVSSSAGNPQCPSSIASVSAYEIPARTRITAVFSMPSLIAIASAVLKPMPRISRARR